MNARRHLKENFALHGSNLEINFGAKHLSDACVCFVYRYKNGELINQRPEFKMKRLRMHSNHALEIKEVCQEDSGFYTVVLKNSAAMLERRLNITLLVNGTCKAVPPTLVGNIKQNGTTIIFKKRDTD